MRDHSFPSDAFPTIVAHRGASATRPENTLASFEEAVRVGARIVELDVRLSRDGVAVVMHDPTVDRTTDGTGAVHELTAVQLGELNAGTPAAREAIPTLADALDLLSGRAGVALEIKNVPGEAAFETDGESIVRATHADLERLGFEGPVLVVSFNPRSIEVSKEIAPGVPTGFLTTEPFSPREALAHAAPAGHEMLLPRASLLLAAGETFVGEVHAAGLRLGTWTVDDPNAIRELFDLGVDAVASNDPATALAALAARPGA